MNPTFQYALLAAVGAVSGLLVQRWCASVRGSIGKRFVLHRLLEGLGTAPGVGLLVYFLLDGDTRPNLFHMLQLMGAFVVPYVGTRVAAYALSISRREGALPFVHWFGLLRTDPAAARDFFKAYVRQYDQRQGELLVALNAGYASLTQRYTEDPLLPAALDGLRQEIARLEEARRVSSGSGKGT